MKTTDGKIQRIPPQNVDAEEAILGAVLTNPICFNKIADMLTPKSFYKPANRYIYEAIVQLFTKNQAIDIVTVSEVLNETEKLDMVGGRAYINDLALNVTTTANIEYYAKIVQEKAIKRELINAGSEIVEMAYDNTSTATTLDNAQSIYDVEYASKKVIVIGNEANGVKNDILKFADKNIYIPMLNNTESLNAGVAASIIMCDVQRKN